jgi:hypothetical protein
MTGCYVKLRQTGEADEIEEENWRGYDGRAFFLL